MQTHHTHCKEPVVTSSDTFRLIAACVSTPQAPPQHRKDVQLACTVCASIRGNIPETRGLKTAEIQTAVMIMQRLPSHHSR